MNISDLIKSAVEDKASSFEEMFDSIMSDRVEIAIQNKFASMYEEKDMEDEDEDEEDDEEEMEDEDEDED